MRSVLCKRSTGTHCRYLLIGCVFYYDIQNTCILFHSDVSQVYVLFTYQEVTYQYILSLNIVSVSIYCLNCQCLYMYMYYYSFLPYYQLSYYFGQKLILSKNGIQFVTKVKLLNGFVTF